MTSSIESYNVATKVRNLEIRLFWQRSNYFLILSTAIATGTLLKLDQPQYAFPLSILGFAVSLMWISINLGSKYWQDRWERKIAEIELQLDPTVELFAVSRETSDREVKEGLRYDDTKWYQLWKRLVNWLVMFKPSVSRTMILLSFAFTLFWGIIGWHSKPVIMFAENHTRTIMSDSLSLARSTQNVMTSSDILSWESLWNFVAVVLGILLGFCIERQISRKHTRSVQKTLVLLVADEVERNIERLIQIVDDAKKTIVPYYQLVTENKDACWPALVEYRFGDRELIREISRSYFEYRLINRTLDMVFFKEGSQSPIFAQSTLPLCRAEIDRSKQLLRRLKEWAIR